MTHATDREISRLAEAWRRWFDDPESAPVSAPVGRGGMFTLEQLEVHARALARSHVLAPGRGGRGDLVLARLSDNAASIHRAHRAILDAVADGRRVTPAEEWLLDNFYLIEEEIRLVRKHLSRGYSRQLPRLKGGEAGGHPRVYEAMMQLIAHVDGKVDAVSLGRFVAAYQSAARFTLGELWAVPIMLRLGALENLRWVSACANRRRAHRGLALRWAHRLNEAGAKRDSDTILVLAEMVRDMPPLSTAFVSEFNQALQGRGSTATFVLGWLDQRLSEQGQNLEEVLRAESQQQAVEQVSVANSVASLRFVDTADWHDFIETHSAAEAALRTDPAGVYPRMDFETRDACRHVVEALARRLRVEEEAVAHRAIEMAAARRGESPDDAGAHVGYWLLDEGRGALARSLRRAARPAPRRAAGPPPLRLAAYLLAIALLTALAVLPLARLALGLGGRWAAAAAALAGAVAASQAFIPLVNRLAALLRRPRPPPRMDFSEGIPDEHRTMVIVPTMLTSARNVEELVNHLEIRHLSNRDPNLWFGLLTDFADAPAERMDPDDALLDLAEKGIHRLNQKHSPGGAGPFFLFHRPRLHNPRERCWLGRERKRGKIEDFNALLRGEREDRFSRIVGDPSRLGSVAYVITLDQDTDLPWGTGRNLVAAFAHPLNHPVLAPSGRRLARGYAILQPRVGVALESARRSRYAALWAGEVGVDPYTRVVSDAYQDLFARGSYIGKGIYHVDTFRHLLEGRFPDNAVLSHDLIESCYAPCALVTDVELLESHPARYLSDVSRRHRWIRGDWQISPWLGRRVREASGRRVPAGLGLFEQWKVFDNLRRSLFEPSMVALFLGAWFFSPDPGAWTLGLLGLLLLPRFVALGSDLLRRPHDLPWRLHLAGEARPALRRFARAAFQCAALPFEALVSLDAVSRALWRMAVSRRRLLEWQTAAAVERAADGRLAGVLSAMWPAAILALAVAGALVRLGRPHALAAAAPVLSLWLLSPLIAWWLGRPSHKPRPALPAREAAFLGAVARLTWRYFEDFVGPQDNWLPPDNHQERPSPRLAHRTSPTNMGLSLTANVAAHDLGFISTAQWLDRTAHALDSMEQMEGYRGHFYNWYDTRTRKPLRPFYVSTVDSGNLVGHLFVLASALNEAVSAQLLPFPMAEGLRQTLRVLGAHMGIGGPPVQGAGGGALPRCDRAPFDRVAGLLADPPRGGLGPALSWLRHVLVAAAPLTSSFDPQLHPEASWWAHAFDRQVRAFLDELAATAPWIAAGSEGLDARFGSALRGIEEAAGLEEVAHRALAAARLIQRHAEEAGDGAPARRLAEALLQGAQHIAGRIRLCRSLAQRCVDLAQADFTFLFNRSQKLLSIGYNVSDRRLDPSAYDLLASEARLASFLAIANGQLPHEHWFAMGRRPAAALGFPALLSWSGSMFEYLMPLLVMPSYDDTLLDQTCRAVVATQVHYGRRRGVPWGISESGYNLTDVEGNYQYRAFGVPGLGLQRGLADDLVVAPYATALALAVDPAASCANLRELAGRGWLGRYGFYEAVDFTASRLPPRSRGAVLRSFMAHHQGMSLVALAQALLGAPMHRRFMAHPPHRAASLLLQERIPKAVEVVRKQAEGPAPAGGPSAAPIAPMRVFTDPNTLEPKLHFLSNGRYHVMVSAAGGGCSRWNEFALTRWRADGTRDCWGTFCYVTDVAAARSWSVSHQPTLDASKGYEAIFTQGRAEFRRRDRDVETHTDIVVSPEDDVEIRRVTLRNRSNKALSLVLTGYAEAVLAPLVTDELHRVFSNLFVWTEVLPRQNALLVSRRPRSAEERPPWMFCLLDPPAGADGPPSFETDRARFLGRGRTPRNPAALEDPGPLSGTQGAVLDPCLAVRQPVRLGPDDATVIDLVLGAAPTREAAMALVEKYQDSRMADRAFELAPTHSGVILAQLGATEPQAQLLGRLASAMVYPSAACRAPAAVLRRNRKGQSGLWGYGISGDHPIALVRVSDTANLGLVRDMLMAHAYWRLKGLLTDLVIWNEDVSGYRQKLNDQIMGLIAAGTETHLLDKPTGIFVRQVDQIAEEDRLLMQAVAHLVLSDADGPLEQQVERREHPPSRLPPPLAPASPGEEEAAVEPLPPETDNLVLFNGTGGFTADGREYLIPMAPGKRPPAPWANVLANPRFGTVVSESGSAYTWFENAQLFRITPWANDPVSDPPGEALYLRDERTGAAFSPAPSPRPGSTGYLCRHGFGYTVFEHREGEIETRLTTWVALGAPVKFFQLAIRNHGARDRSLGLFACFDLVLGDLRSRNAMHVLTEVDPRSGTLLARNPFNGDFGGAVAFLDCSEHGRSVSGDRREFLGRNGDPRRPAALGLRRLSGRVGPSLDPCLAMQTLVELPPNGEREVVFVLGAGRDAEEASAVARNHCSVGAARVALEEVWRFWNDRLGILYAETPDPALNLLVNGWLPYQVLSCRLWGRSGFYQSGGAYGFRDQLQDCVATLHEAPEVAREHLLRCAGRQFVEGDVQHWWHPPTGRGVRTTCSDDYLWLPWAVDRYASFTSDTGVLDEKVGFLAGAALRPEEESRYDLPSRAEAPATLYEHCVRAIRHGLRFGPHGLPLIGSGDWNDGMNRVGHQGKGESVWLAFFLHHVLSRFGPLAERRGDAAFAAECASAAARLAENIERHAWDGRWYLRGFFDDGTPLGSSTSPECRIDSLPQSWAVLSGAGDPARADLALDAAWEHLVQPDPGLVKLFDPPFDTSALKPGYIKGYLPGVRENGGQYTHAAVWVAMAFAAAGRTERAWSLFSMLNPVRHGGDEAGVRRYKVEPYVVAADVYASPQHLGRGGWSWYTGSAGWLYRLFHEVLLGLERHGDVLRFRPRLPPSWPAFKVHYRYYQTFFHIDMVPDPAHQGPPSVSKDGEEQAEGLLRLLNDTQEHQVEVRFQPARESALAAPPKTPDRGSPS